MQQELFGCTLVYGGIYREKGSCCSCFAGPLLKPQFCFYPDCKVSGTKQLGLIMLFLLGCPRAAVQEVGSPHRAGLAAQCFDGWQETKNFGALGV